MVYFMESGVNYVLVIELHQKSHEEWPKVSFLSWEARQRTDSMIHVDLIARYY